MYVISLCRIKLASYLFNSVIVTFTEIMIPKLSVPNSELQLESNLLELKYNFTTKLIHIYYSFDTGEYHESVGLVFT